MSGFEDRLRSAAGASRVKSAEPMSLHTSFRIGGPAEWFVEAGSEEAVVRVLALCREEEVPCHVIGNGSNLLVSDAGVPGVVLCLGNAFSDIAFEGETVTAQTGILLSRLARMAAQKGLAGLAFAAGIPGTLGGGLYMNAGAYGGELVQVVTGARLLFPDGTVRDAEAPELALGYRRSSLMDSGAVALSVTLKLREGDEAAIFAEMDDLAARRRDKQPLEYPSAGSTFKRPAGHYAGQLIEAAGLKGARVGGACVSEKHAGFVINDGGATAADVLALCELVQEKVYASSGIHLEREIRFLGA
ncbi:MAG: UDP-N-acetylmuramate dehydrogenase [Lachnospiraceae bacterium]|nr:UDP-N-acetylmuramate dehydrogenase [Lachnospiraceae bacterium]